MSRKTGQLPKALEFPPPLLEELCEDREVRLLSQEEGRPTANLIIGSLGSALDLPRSTSTIGAEEPIWPPATPHLGSL